MNLPEPVPSEDFVSAVVGVVLVELQQKPRAIIWSPPSDDISPLTVTELPVIFVTEEDEEVVTTGRVLGCSFLQFNNRSTKSKERRVFENSNLDFIVKFLRLSSTKKYFTLK